MSEHLLTTTPFSSLALPPELLRGTEDAGFEFCTPIQAEALPHALDGHDVEGQAQTGTGKSAAFLLATMNHLLRHPPRKDHREGDPRALIFAPTRELAVQIHKDALVLGKHTGLRIGVVFGGMAIFLFRRFSVNRQIRLAQRKAAKIEAEATEEAIYNSILKATTTTGYRNHHVEAIPLDALRTILKRHGRP